MLSDVCWIGVWVYCFCFNFNWLNFAEPDPLFRTPTPAFLSHPQRRKMCNILRIRRDTYEVYTWLSVIITKPGRSDVPGCVPSNQCSLSWFGRRTSAQLLKGSSHGRAWQTLKGLKLSRSKLWNADVESWIAPLNIHKKRWIKCLIYDRTRVRQIQHALRHQLFRHYLSCFPWHNRRILLGCYIDAHPSENCIVCAMNTSSNRTARSTYRDHHRCEIKRCRTTHAGAKDICRGGESSVRRWCGIRKFMLKE